jgi:hypothetical protein
MPVAAERIKPARGAAPAVCRKRQTSMAQTQQLDTGLVQRGLLLLGGMTALVVVVLLIALRRPETPTKNEPGQTDFVMPAPIPVAAFPATPGWPMLIRLGRDLPSAPGWEIRYNAAVTLARRGSPHTPWPLIQEMLDEDQQRRNFRTPLKNGKAAVDEESALRTVQNTLAAVAQWHTKRDRAGGTAIPADLQRVYDQVDRLAEGSNTMLRVQADRVRQTFFRP